MYELQIIYNVMKKTKNNSGFTLIEALVLLFIFSLITITFYQVISVGTRHILFAKNRLGAIALANEKMEIVRNLSYDYVGIQGGACEGIIPQDEDVSENGRNYHVHTLATFVDDSFDGTLGGSPNDTAYKDYKIIKITVSWNNGGADAGSVYLLSRFVPPGLETATSGDGILSINIFSDQDGGAGVPQATVQVVNSDLGFSETRQTDDSGNIMIVGAEESIQKYQISVSKSDYETVSTFPAYPDTDYNPVDVHASVVTGAMNVTNIALNKTADLKIITKNYLFDTIIPDMEFKLIGGRRIGNDEVFPYDPIYNLDEEEQTNSSGEKQYEEISPGQYSFTLSDSVTEYELIGTNPASPFSLLSEDDLNLEVRLASKDMTSVLVSVKKAESSTVLAGANVKLSNLSGYEEEIITDDNGTAFFPKTSTPLIAGTYNLEITADGYEEYSETVEVEENHLSEKNILLVYE